jgi:hypothetical protein
MSPLTILSVSDGSTCKIVWSSTEAATLMKLDSTIRMKMQASSTSKPHGLDLISHWITTTIKFICFESAYSCRLTNVRNQTNISFHSVSIVSYPMCYELRNSCSTFWAVLKST